MTYFSIVVIKFIRFILKLSGRGSGTAFPGLIGEKFFYKWLTTLPKKLDYIIIITGTNGKTTSSKIIRSILKQNHINVVSNISGANLTRGIIATLVFNTNIWGKMKSKIGVFEVEEASMEKTVKFLKPNICLVTNLFRDQMDAYGELDHTKEVIVNGIKQMDISSIVILCANDPKVASIAKDLKQTVRYFGLDDTNIPQDKDNTVTDSTKSPEDSSDLIYSHIYYSHIGIYDSKSFKMPQLDYKVLNYNIDQHDKELPSVSFELRDNIKNYEVKVKDFKLIGIYNVVNCLGAFSAIENLENIKIQNYSNISPAFGRGERIKLKSGNYITLILVKNPTGFNSALGAINEVEKKNIIFGLNDNTADGKDVSWIWDCNFEAMRNYDKIVVAGDRAEDLALRCKYADLPYFIASSYENALKEFIEYKDDEGYYKTKKDVEIYALCSYTSLIKFRQYLSGIADLKPIEQEV